MTSLNGRAGSSGVAADERDWRARGLVLGAAAILVVVALPVILHGALLADEYRLCMRPQQEGFAAYFSFVWSDTGIVRPARFLELFLVAGFCERVPFGAAIVVPLLIKLAGAPLLWGLLRDLRVPSPWPAVGAALWLLEPLGTEAALWPAALHVNLGLAFALAALRLHLRGRTVLGALTALAACLSVEQAIFALPLAAWLVTPREHRRYATIATAVVCVSVLTAYALWSGENPRQDLTLAQHLANLVGDPTWFARFPVVGLGLHSGLMGFLWALPWSVLLVAGAAVAGWRYAPGLLAGGPDTPPARAGWRVPLLIVVLLGLINLPLLVTGAVHSPRTFTPTWLVLAAVVAIAGSRLPASRHRLAGLLTGTFTAFAVLSLMLSAWVRVETVAFNEAAFAWIAEQTRDGDVVAVCDVERTVVEPAPSGAFHLHQLHSTYSGALEYHTGRMIAELRVGGESYWGARCPDLTGADLIVEFEDLLTVAGQR